MEAEILHFLTQFFKLLITQSIVLFATVTLTLTTNNSMGDGGVYYLGMVIVEYKETRVFQDSAHQ